MLKMRETNNEEYWVGAYQSSVGSSGTLGKRLAPSAAAAHLVNGLSDLYPFQFQPGLPLLVYGLSDLCPFQFLPDLALPAPCGGLGWPPVAVPLPTGNDPREQRETKSGPRVHEISLANFSSNCCSRIVRLTVFINSFIFWRTYS